MVPRSYLRLVTVGLSLLVAGGLGVRAATLSGVQRASVTSAGAEGSGDSSGPIGLSADGRFIVFTSSADLFPLDFANPDIYIRDFQTGLTQIVSLANPLQTGDVRRPSNGLSANASISGDGRFVAFESDASNLIVDAAGASADTNTARDVFVRDLRGSVYRASVASGGAQANGASRNAQISADGGFVVFESAATNLVAGDANAASDVFVAELIPVVFGSGLTIGTVRRVSVSSTGAEGNGGSRFPSISADGRFVAFESDASNLVANDTNAKVDVFVHDLFQNTTERVSVSSDFGTSTGPVQAGDDSFLPAISADGRFVAFVSRATNLGEGDGNLAADVFVHDRLAVTTERVSVDTAGEEGGDDSGIVASDPIRGRPAISEDGRFILFVSEANSLDPSDANDATDVFLRDTVLGTTDRVSLGDGGVEANGISQSAAISADATVIGFESLGSNLVGGDTNGFLDVFAAPNLTGGGTGGNQPPLIVVEPFLDVVELDQVVLDASATEDDEGDPLTFQWRQVEGPTVTLTGANTAVATFTAPLVGSFEVFDFEIEVSDGVNPPEVELVTVTVSPAGPGTLFGTVRDAQGNALVGATVRVVRDADEEPATEVTTDGAGNFNVPDVRIGRNTVTVIPAESDGLEPVLETIDFVVNSSGQGSIIRRDFIVNSVAATLEGTVRRSNGAPLAGATVEILDGFGEVLGSAETDSAGEYRIRGLSRFDINAAAVARVDGAGELSPFAVGGLQLTPGTVNQRNFQYGNLTVTVDGSPKNVRKRLKGTTVEVLVGDEVIASGQLRKNQRKLSFRDVPGSLVRVRASNPALTGAAANVNVQPGRNTGVTLLMRARGVF